MTTAFNCKLMLLKCCIASIVLMQLGCERVASIKETATNFAADLIPTNAIEALDQQSWNQMKLGLKTVEGPEIKAALGFLVAPLIEAAVSKGTPAFEWDFHVVKSEDLNAFALPGGTIAVNSGLLQFSESGLEVIGILAHEVAHVAAKHGVKSMMLQTGVSAATSMIVGAFLGDFSGISDWAITGIAKLGLLKYSRDNEREADTLGAELLQKAGYPISGLTSFFVELDKQKNQKQLSGALVQKSLSLFSTHPMSTERAQILEKLALQQSTKTLNPEQIQKYNTLRKLVLQSIK